MWHLTKNSIFTLACILACEFYTPTSCASIPDASNSSYLGEKELVGSLPGLNFTLNYRHFSGYLDSVNNSRLHYWLFESQSGHANNDPVVLWLNGGPGCSSMLGALTELGPIRVGLDGKLVENPYGWNQKANILFVESPAGVGFSYKPDHKYHNTDLGTAELNFEALKSFFKKFPHFETNDFYITGESYAGIYVPTLSTLVWKNKYPKNFKGLAIGNAYLDTSLLSNSVLHFYYYHGMLDTGNWDNLLENCCKNLTNQPKSARTMLKVNTRYCNFVDQNDAQCRTARSHALRMVNEAHLNAYNIYDQCSPSNKYADPDNTIMKSIFENYDLMYNEKESDASNGDHDPPCDNYDHVSAYLNQPVVRKALNIDANANNWSSCRDVNYVSSIKSVKQDIIDLVNAGHKVLIYNGDVDSVCNFIGDQWFVEELGFKVNIAYHPWTLNGQVAGYSTFYDKYLTFTTIRGAGHMVPADRPEAALRLFNDFLGK